MTSIYKKKEIYYDQINFGKNLINIKHSDDDLIFNDSLNNNISLSSLVNKSVAYDDIYISVDVSGDDSSPDRPEKIFGGDYTSLPFATIQSAINSLPGVSRPYSIFINIGSGNFSGAILSGFDGILTIIGQSELSTLTTGPNTDTATSGATRTITLTAAGWTVNELRGKFIRIVSGTGIGQVSIIAENTTDTITVAKKWTTVPTSTSVFEIYEPTTIINTNVLDSSGYSLGLGFFDYSGKVTLENIAIAIPGTIYFGAVFVRGQTAVLRDVSITGTYYPILAQDLIDISWNRFSIISTLYYGAYFLRIANSVGLAGQLYIGNSAYMTRFYGCKGVEINGFYNRSITGAYGLNLWACEAVLTDVVIKDSVKGFFVAQSSIIMHGLILDNISAVAIELQDGAWFKVKTSLSMINTIGVGIVLATGSVFISQYISSIAGIIPIQLEATEIDIADVPDLFTELGDCITGVAGSRVVYSNV
jgi:hypothetical protein